MIWTGWLHDRTVELLNDTTPSWLDLPLREKIRRLLDEATQWRIGLQLTGTQIHVLTEIVRELDPRVTKQQVTYLNVLRAAISVQ